MKIAIIGAGALGTLLAGRLAGPGHEIWLLHHSEEYMTAIDESGIYIGSENGDVHEAHIRTTADAAAVGPVGSRDRSREVVRDPRSNHPTRGGPSVLRPACCRYRTGSRITTDSENTSEPTECSRVCPIKARLSRGRKRSSTPPTAPSSLAEGTRCSLNESRTSSKRWVSRRTSRTTPSPTSGKTTLECRD